MVLITILEIIDMILEINYILHVCDKAGIFE
jgi:hypothetical protein